MSTSRSHDELVDQEYYKRVCTENAALRAEVERLQTALERIDYLIAQPQDDDTDPNEYRPTVTEVQAINVVLAQALRGKDTHAQ